jgi:thiamine-phosphate pyrophosphorylase
MTNPPCQLYLITPPVIDDIDAFLPVLESALSAAPVACLQIRLKDLEDSALVQAATPICALAQRLGVAVILNDRPDLVDAIGADGVHIGQEDMDYLSSRELLEAAGAGADYVAFGAFYKTTTKAPKFKADLEILSWWQHAMETPVVAIGGITPGNAEAVIKAGADFIAVSSGVWQHPDGAAASVRLLSSLCAEHSSPLA